MIRRMSLLGAALALASAGCIVTPDETCDAAGGPIHCNPGLTCNPTSGLCEGAGTQGGSTAGTSAGSGGSGGTTGSCAGLTVPAIHCARQGGELGWLVVGETPVITCTVDPGSAPSSWTAAVNPGFFTADARSAPDAVYVNLVASGVPIDFGDTDVAVTVTAHFCAGAATTDVVHLNVVGNTLAADHWEGNVKVYSSGGTSLGLLGGAVVSGSPNMLATLANGDVLVGSSTQLVELSRGGALVKTFDVADHASAPLFPGCGDGCITEPWAAAEAADGNIWVTANSGRDSNGFIYRFSPAGRYLDTVPRPTGANPTYWLPMGIARRGDGAMLVSTGAEQSPAYLALYPSGGVSGTYMQAQVQDCTASGCTTPTFNDMGLSGIWIDPDGTLYATNIWEDDEDGDLAAFDATTLAFHRASVHPTSGLDPTYNKWFRGLTRAGDRLLVAVWNSCVWAVDPQTLMPLPEGRGVSANGCIAGTGVIDLRSVAHLGAAP